MDSARALDAIKCMCFSIFLGVATMLLTRIPPRSISSFDQLVKEIHRIVQNAHDVLSLSNLFQGSGESLKDFLQRLNTVVTEVNNPQDNIILMTLIKDPPRYRLW